MAVVSRGGYPIDLAEPTILPSCRKADFGLVSSLQTGSTALPGAAEAIQKFRQMGKRVFFCTNNSTKSRSDYVEKCQKLGFGGNIVISANYELLTVPWTDHVKTLK